MAKTFKDLSREDWEPSALLARSMEAINTGALQRIADATEVMAKNYQQLIDERNRYKEYYLETRAERDKLYRRISALQGVITRLKRRAKQ
jgi:hypothetical protein